MTTNDRILNGSGLSTVLGLLKDKIDEKADASSIVTPVQSDWAQATTTSLDYIKNKPILPKYNILEYIGKTASPVEGDYSYYLQATDIADGTTHVYSVPAYTTTPELQRQVTTKEYVDNQINAVTSSIPTAVSELTNDSNFISYGGVTVTSSFTSGVTVLARIDGKQIDIYGDITRITGTHLSNGVTYYYDVKTLYGTSYTIPAYSTSITDQNQLTTKKYVDDSIAASITPYVAITSVTPAVGITGPVIAHIAGITIHAPAAEGGIQQESDPIFNSSVAAEITSTDITNWNSKIDASALTPYVPNSRTINGQSLTANITLDYQDVGAASVSHTHDYSKVSITQTQSSGIESAKIVIDGVTTSLYFVNTTYGLADEREDGLMAAQDKNKLDDIEPFAEQNVQSDWAVTTTTSDAFIKNKPTVVYDSERSAIVFTGF